MIDAMTIRFYIARTVKLIKSKNVLYFIFFVLLLSVHARSGYFLRKET